jgi:hypothetical protein
MMKMNNMMIMLEFPKKWGSDLRVSQTVSRGVRSAITNESAGLRERIDGRICLGQCERLSSIMAEVAARGASAEDVRKNVVC